MDERPFIHENNSLYGKNCTIHRNIFLYGRKTIATITDIHFVPVDKRVYRFSNIRIEASPTYRISYKFNPPDDDTTEDIIHSIDTHVCPEGRFKVGDPLPILYLMQTSSLHKLNNFSKNHVTHSMPFPLPIEDIETEDNYLGSTRQSNGLEPANHGSDVFLS